MTTVLIIICCFVLLLLFLLAPGSAAKEKRAPFFGRNIAHRGLHEQDQSIPENSLAAFSRAVEQGYGMELDVQLSRDGQVVVFHDDTLDRACGVSSRVDAFDYRELKEMRLFGSEEGMPLFSEVLKEVGGREPMIVELKTGPRNAELCKKTLDLLREYKGVFCIESFDPTIVAWFRKNAPDILRGQLAQPVKRYAESNTKKPLAFLLGNTLLNVIARPQFIAYRVGDKPFTVKICEAFGAMKVCWTSHSSENEKKYDTVIFEYYQPETRFK